MMSLINLPHWMTDINGNGASSTFSVFKTCYFLGKYHKSQMGRKWEVSVSGLGALGTLEKYALCVI